MKRYLKEYLILFGIGGAILALDQWTKWLVRENIPFRGSWLPDWLMWLAPYARIVHWENSGAAFGMFQDGNLIFTILAFIVIGVIIYYYPLVERDDWPLRLVMGMQIGGAAGNLTDRLISQKVTDFISVGNFPVFNIADSSISVGVAILLLGTWWRERMEKKKAARQEQPEKNGDAANGKAEMGEA
jgi:signal peptidase II